MRIVLVFRLFKRFRYFNSIKVFINVLSRRRFELVTLGVFLGFLALIGNAAIYLFEKTANGGQVKKSV